MKTADRIVRAHLVAAIAIASSLVLGAVPAGAVVRSNDVVAAPNALTAVSCPTSTWCVAVDDQGNAYTYSGTSNTWSPGVDLDLAVAMTSISCTSALFCMAGDTNGNTYAYDGASWSSASQPDGSTVTGISCTPAPTSCMVVTENGNAFVSTNEGQSWDTFSPSGGAPLDAVSCATAAFCVATDDAGNAFSFDGSTWSVGTLVSAFPLTSLSCVTATFCAAADSQGNVFMFNGSNWIAVPHNPVGAATGATALTCPTTSLCVLGDANGNIYVDENGTWTPDPADPVDGGGGGITAISCSSNNFCVVADNNGDALVYAPPTPPVAPVVPLPQNALVITTVSGVVGVPLTLETVGGSGEGTITFQVTPTGSTACALSSSNVLTAEAPGSCTVTATKASDGTYAATSSSATQVTFVAPLVLPPPPVKKRPVARTHLITRVVGPFANGSFALRHSLISAVDDLAAAAQRNDDHRVTVSGYASSAGTLSQNRALSLARARVVAAHLRAACADRHFSVAITAVGRGVGSASTPAANRVVDVTLH